MIVRVQSIALTAGVSASYDAGNAVDHEVGADRNGHRSPKVAAACTRRSLRSDKCASASPGRRAKYTKIRPTVAVERTAKAKTTMGAPNGDVREPRRRRRSGPRLLEDPDGGCFPRIELFQAGRELLGDCPLCWLGEVTAIKTTLSAATQRIKALQALLSRHIAAHLGMPGSIPQRERITQKPDQCRRARTAGSGCPQPAGQSSSAAYRTAATCARGRWVIRLGCDGELLPLCGLWVVGHDAIVDAAGVCAAGAGARRTSIWGEDRPLSSIKSPSGPPSSKQV